MKIFDLWASYTEDLYSEYGKDGKKVHVAFDCKTGQIYEMTRPSKNPRMKNLGCYKLEGSWYLPIRRQIKEAIGFICKTRAIKKYGSRVVDNTPVFSETDNPHFSCAEPMKIYAVPMLEYVDRELKRQV